MERIDTPHERITPGVGAWPREGAIVLIFDELSPKGEPGCLLRVDRGVGVVRRRSGLLSVVLHPWEVKEI